MQRSKQQALMFLLGAVLTAVLVWLTGAWTLVLIPIFAFFILRDVRRRASRV